MQLLEGQATTHLAPFKAVLRISAFSVSRTAESNGFF
jgi:hypothetical protein